MVGRLVREWTNVLSLRDSYSFRACTLTHLVNTLMQGANITPLADPCCKRTKQTVEQTATNARWLRFGEPEVDFDPASQKYPIDSLRLES